MRRQAIFRVKNLKIKIILWAVTIPVLTAIPPQIQAQPLAKMPRLGLLMALSPDESADIKAFRQGLAALGYVEGKNIALEYRYAEGKLDRLPALAAELVGLKVDVIVALSPPTARAAKDATTTIPIVMRSTDDPVATGLVASLARPGGNITGLTSISTELIGKRLEILKEAVPKARIIAVLRNPSAPDAALKLKETEAASRALGLKIHSVEVQSVEAFPGAFTTATQKRSRALIVLRNPMIVNNRKRIAELAAKSKLAAMYDDREFVDAGGLMSYGADLADLHRRLAVYVDKILKGAKPAELPVEQPMKFQYIVNLKAAKQIGLTIPPNVLVRADRVIK